MEPFLLGVCLRVLRAKMAYMKTVECFVAVALPLSDQPNVKDALLEHERFTTTLVVSFPPAERCGRDKR